MSNNRQRNIHYRKSHQCRYRKNQERKPRMGAAKPHDRQKQVLPPKGQDTNMELFNTKRNYSWTARKGPTETHTWEYRNIYVQSHKSNDDPAMEYRRMVPRKEPTLQENASVDDGITAQQNTNRDNADTDARHKRYTGWNARNSPRRE